MNLKEALDVISGNGSKLLIPVKMGFFVMIRPVAPDTFPKPSVPAALREEHGWLPECDFECRPVEVTSGGWRPIEKLQGRWVQWGVEGSDIERDTFMVV